MGSIAVFTSIDSPERARAIATALVERRLAACVQVSTIESVYSWQGAVQNDMEYRVMAKTMADRYPEVEAAIRELHSYDLPAIYALDVAAIFEPYAEWVAEYSSGRSTSMIELKVTGMTCGHCEKAVDTALAGVPGVTRVVKVGRDVERVVVEGDADVQALIDAIEEEGYTAELVT